MSAVGSLQAQILVGPAPGGSGVLTFDSAPVATEFASRAVPGANSAPITPAAMDTLIQTNTAASVGGTLGTENSALAAFTPALANFQWRSDAGLHHLASRATGGSLNLMKATLQNNSGGDATAIDIDYDFGVTVNSAFTISEDAGLAGFRVYYSLTGLTNGLNNWVLIPGLTNPVAGHLSAHVDLIWPSGSPLYLLWADDNGVPGSSDPAAPATTGNVEGCYSIDNFRLVPTTGVIPCPAITNGPVNVTLPQCPAGNATFSISVTGGVQSIQWQRNSGTGFTNIPGANSASYTLAGAAVSDSGSSFQAVVTPISVSCSAVTSSAATLTVVADTTPPSLIFGYVSTNLTNIVLFFDERIGTNCGACAELYANVILVDTNTGNQVATLAGQIYAAGNRSVAIYTDGTPLDISHGYSITLSLVEDECAANVLPDTTYPIGRLVEHVIVFDSDWKYDINNGDRFGTGWETVGFNDSAWPSGIGGLGHESDTNATNVLLFPIGTPGNNFVPIRTHLNYASNGVPVFFRKHFTLPGSGTNSGGLVIHSVMEDGAVYFINGQEAFRQTVGAGTLSATTLTTASAAEPVNPPQGPFFVPATGLVPGDNVIAVAVLQSSATSSDIEMALDLSIVLQHPLPLGPTLHISANGSVSTITWTGGGTLQRSLDIGSPANWVNIPGASSPFVTNAPPAIQFFRVTVP